MKYHTFNMVVSSCIAVAVEHIPKYRWELIAIDVIGFHVSDEILKLWMTVN